MRGSRKRDEEKVSWELAVSQLVDAGMAKQLFEKMQSPPKDNHDSGWQVRGPSERLEQNCRAAEALCCLGLC